MNLFSVLKNITKRFGIIVHQQYKDKRWMLKEKRALIRPSIREIKKKFGRQLVGAEIGVLRGKNAKVMLEVLPLKRLYLIDPYLEYEEYKREDKDRSQMSMNNNRKIAHDLLSGYDETIWINEMSSNAVELINDRLDFVYIDGNHSYKYVKNDIQSYYPLLKGDGILAGHDFNWHGVTRAVQEFVCKNSYELHVGRIGGGVDWWINIGEKDV